MHHFEYSNVLSVPEPLLTVKTAIFDCLTSETNINTVLQSFTIEEHLFSGRSGKKHTDCGRLVKLSNMFRALKL